MTNAVVLPSKLVGFVKSHYPLSPSSPLTRPIVEPLPSGTISYPTIRKAYHAARTQDLSLKARIVSCRSNAELMEVVSTIVDRPEWDLIKERVMMRLIREKFSDPSHKRLLLATDDAILIHRSESNDVYWGTNAEGEGHNRYGHLLMKYRNELRREAMTA